MKADDRVLIPGTELGISKKKLQGLKIIIFKLYKLLFQPQMLHELNFGRNVLVFGSINCFWKGKDMPNIFYHCWRN